MEPPDPEFAFPDTFLFGVASSAFQTEGALREDGRSESVWDEFVRRQGTIADGSNADIATNSYHLLDADLALLRQLGCGSYRFSFSWPRLLPNAGKELNPAGLDYYNRLIDGLLENSIEPFATLFHWDLPVELERAGGWDNPAIATAFEYYASLCVGKFGDRIRFWSTFNEPQIFWHLGYNTGEMAPGRTSLMPSLKQVHHILVAHGRAIRAMRDIRPENQYGIVQFVSPVEKAEDCSERTATIARGWIQELFFDPIFKGEYPEVTHALALLQRFHPSPDDMATIQQKLDFIGVNHYFRSFVRQKPWSIAQYETIRGNYPGIQTTEMGWEIYPDGMYQTLRWVHDTYGPIPIYVTESGMANDDLLIDGEVDDQERIDYLCGYLQAVSRAHRDGVDVRGYFVWTLLDNFEWAHGLAKRFGLVFVDHTSQKRTPKESFFWYRDFLQAHRLGCFKQPENVVGNQAAIDPSGKAHLEN